jgi:hypothetical protein
MDKKGRVTNNKFLDRLCVPDSKEKSLGAYKRTCSLHAIINKSNLINIFIGLSA